MGPVVVARPTRCRAVAANYLEEEPEVLDVEKHEEVLDVEEEEVNPLTPSAFEV